MKFRLKSAFKPTLDQEKAISKLVRGIEKGVPYQVLLGVTGSGKSLSYGEPVFVFELSNNRCKPKVLPIGELTESLVRKAEQEKTVYLTYSINPKSGKQEIKPIRQFIRHRSPRYMYEVKTTCGRKIIVTGDHNFWVLRNGRLKLIKTKEVKESDYIPIPRKIDIKNTRLKKILLLEWIKRRAYFDASLLSSSNKKLALSLRKDERLALSYLPKLNIERQKLRSIKIGRRIGRETPLVMNITTNLLYFLGLFIAEGHAEKNYSLLSVHEKKLQFLFLKWAKSLNLVPKERKHRPGDFQINYSIWSEVLANWCGARAKEKRLPPWYMELSNRQLSFLLSGYFSGDAGVTKNEIQVASASKRLINDLMYALLRFGIIARVREKPKRATNSNMERAIYYELTISGSENLKFFLQEIGFVLKRKQRKLEDIIREIPNTNVDLVPLWGPDIREIRTALHLSQKTLANLSSCTRSLISLIENNKRNPSRNTLGNILKVFRKRLRIEKSEATTPISFLESLCNAFWTKVRFIKRIKRSSKYVYDIAVENNETFLAGRGGIYVHNTFTVANVIERLGRPTLIISHNKTLAAQLYQELRDFFPENAVSYFVSYYDFYQPEAYIPSTDTYIEKDADINELIDKLRLATTTNLLTRADTIVVASVSCIYNIGSPKEYGNFVFEFAAGMKVAREEIIDRLVDLQYERGDFGFHRGTFRVRGDTIDVYPAYQDAGVRIELTADKIRNVSLINTVTGKTTRNWLKNFILYPAKHFITDPAQNKEVFEQIRKDLDERTEELKKQGKMLEAQRLGQRVEYDLEMIQEVGYVKGIENYSRYFDGRAPDEPPYTLLDYFTSPHGKDWLVIVDEGHMTFPQIRGMYNGDLARKKILVEYGFRLPAALDNRPLKFAEFMRRIPNFITTSATPGQWEIGLAKGRIVEQLLRPTGIPDPQVEIRPTKNQVTDVINEIKKQTAKKQRTLVTTLTKRTAEDLATYLAEQGLKVHYLHSDIKTLDRGDILDDLRAGKYDVLVGINLLREGLDLPEVSLVAILDADKEGFLRSEVTLIQTMGRAARHVEGRVILYADTVTGSIKRALAEVKRRRDYQIKMNKKYGIKPRSIEKPIRQKLITKEEEPIIDSLFGRKAEAYSQLPEIDIDSLTPLDKKKLATKLRREMLLAANDLNFELAAEIRDKIKEII